MYEKTRLLDSFCYFCESLHGIMDERRKIEEPVSAEFERFNKDFEASLRSETTRLQSAIDVILNSTGKHVRPLLVLLTAKVCGQVTDNTINYHIEEKVQAKKSRLLISNYNAAETFERDLSLEPYGACVYLLEAEK